MQQFYFSLLIFTITLLPTANAALWQDASPSSDKKLQARSTSITSNQVARFPEARLLAMDLSELQYFLSLAPLENSQEPPVKLTLPLPDGEFASYEVFLSPVMPPLLAARYPEIQTYRAIDTDNPANIARLDLTPQGFHALLNHNGREIYIDPIGDKHQYQSYYKQDYINHRQRSLLAPQFICKTTQQAITSGSGSDSESGNRDLKQARISLGTELTTFRLAMAVDGEFTQFHGGSKALAMAAIATGVNRINQVYERDLAVKLELVDNNDLLVFEDPDTDPFNADWSEVAAQVINSRIGLESYDIGHVMGGNGDGGLAELGAVCNPDIKAGGETSSDSPINDPFFIDYVAHELGHQFGAEHSFNGTRGSCGGGNRSAAHAYEPGSGSTIMGYAGICMDENLQNNSDAYFHNDSIDQIRTYLSTTIGSSCGSKTSLNNQLPSVNAGSDATIPSQTPFLLTGDATDSDAGNTLTYNWEQMDLGPATSGALSMTDDGKRP